MGMRDIDNKVEVILKMSKLRDLIEKDLQNIMDAKNAKDGEGMKTALHSFYENRKTLKDKGVDESVVKKFDDEVDAILKKKNFGQGRISNIDRIENDLHNIMDAKNSEDREGMNAALHSLSENRRAFKYEAVKKKFDNEVDAVLSKPDVSQSKNEN